MYNRILVATDGSDNAQRATRQALDLARQYGAELHAVYVIETRTGYDNAIVDPDTVRQNLREDGEEALDTIEAEGEPDVSVVTSVREGIPHEELLWYIEEQEIDLVVMGAKGRSAFKTILLGSTTEALLRADQVPVLVVNSTGE
ncbi:universal stress protein UspA [Haloarcula rubripromontorii]|uniref:Universal stress protein n=1 Tax=Haloarcula rubripromontorii TaxID=1705562 RepID=A0A0M9AGD4_9EURY|nr:universal stress protein [Haloarcula rubripromontorii]KOX91459.1 universal stress protein UspA [Haloarcula rubripromontorii]NLV05924.1 universal stress protein [Haloarcula rubripromontorii]